MNALGQEKCAACRADSPHVTAQEMQELLPQIPAWQIVEHNGIPQLERTFKFKNFAQALAFTNRIGALAQEQDHHPKLCTEYGKTTVTWWTHKIRGLHRNDFVMAAKCDQEFRTTGAM